jgi:hypothetical protein
MIKKQVEFVRDNVISHIVTWTSSEWQVIKNAWQNTDISRKANPMMMLMLCILFWDHITSFNETCLFFVYLFFWNQEMFSILLWQNTLIKLQHAIKVNQSWKIKSVLIAEMTRYLLKCQDKQQDMTKQILSSHTKLNHTAKF